MSRSTRSRYVLPVLLCILAGLSAAHAQQIVDKTVATVSDGVRTELILYSDLMWQLALQPNIPLDQPSSEDLNQALNTLIDQRLFALEAERLPRDPPTEAEIDAEIKLTLARFRSSDEFVARLNKVGFSSIKDEDFERLIRRRLSIENYIDFRFRSFVVVTAEEENRYYADVFVPDFRRRHPGVLVPTIEEQRSNIHETLVEQRVATKIESFLDDAKRRNEIVILNEV